MASTPEDKRAKLARLLRATIDEPKLAPASFAQERFWFLEQWSAGTATMAVAVRLEGGLDREALRCSLEGIVRRHETLRTTFAIQDGRPVQVIAPSLPIPTPFVDLGASPASTREREARSLVASETGKPFDLTQGPLFRAVLIRLGAREHLLSFSMHHIISDGWSAAILVREIAALYQAAVDGQPAALPPLRVQYADYAAWQRGFLQGETLEAQLAYWRGRLDPSALLALPTDRPRQAAPSPRGARVAVTLPMALAVSVKALGQREGRTLFVTLLAAFQILLSRYTAETDLTVGTAIAGRTRTELEGLVGPFINSLALRVDLAFDPTFREALGRVHEAVLGAFAHQDLPFEKLVSALGTERHPGRTPLFQVMFILQSDFLRTPELPGMVLDAESVDTGTAKFELTVIAAELALGLRLTAEYSTDLFDATTIERMLVHYQRLLAGAVTRPDARVSELPLLTPEERHQLLVTWNATAAAYPEEACLHELFEAQVARSPEAVAVVFEGAPLTYGELNRRANRLAHHLRALSVGPEVLVGLCVERSMEMVVGVLGILKAGGAYVPLDPSYPKERLAFMVKDAAMPVVIVHERSQAVLPKDTAAVLCLDSAWSEVARRPENDPPPSARPHNLAYVIYTSGSTGTPKGAMNAHRGVVNRLRWGQEAYRLTAHDAVLQKTPMSFDVSVWELFWPLLCGARLVLARPEGHKDVAYLTELVRSQGITTRRAWIVPGRGCHG